MLTSSDVYSVSFRESLLLVMSKALITQTTVHFNKPQSICYTSLCQVIDRVVDEGFHCVGHDFKAPAPTHDQEILLNSQW